MTKSESMLCGAACLFYIYSKENIKNYSLNENIRWISELGINLMENTDFDINLYFYNSKLYNDYVLQINRPINFEGFDKLFSFEKHKKIIEKELNESALKNEIINNKYLIINVESAKINNDHNMNGGHFIILNGMINNNEVKVINPKKNYFEQTSLTINQIVDYSKNFGCWRIIIK